MSKFFEEYQRQVDNGCLIKPDANKLDHALKGLAGEAGEALELQKKSEYLSAPDGGPDVTRLAFELGDALFYLSVAASEIGLTVAQVALMNITKLEERHPTRGYSSDRLNELLEQEVE